MGSDALERFQIEARLGAGGMGVVFSAFDRVRGARVALKRIQHFDPEALIRFKNEFRALSDITHPNLVALHELLFMEDEYLFTMELVDGATDFLRYVRPHDAELRTDAETRSDRTVSMAAQDPEDPVVAPSSSPPSGPDEPRLRSSLKQLALGLQALHDAGKLHRDLKPGNILVSPEGRVLICDFGLILDVARPASTPEPASGSGSDLAGTPSYMSPEQVLGLPLNPASDWYAVGVLLFHALVGRPPFTGGRLAVLSRKTEQEAPDPSTLLAGVPEDLAYLCTRLLCRDPAQRLGGPEVLRFLGVVPAARVTSEASRPLVGREGPLRALEEALARTRETGGARAVLVQGPSGMGKSTLVRHFCAKAEETQGALVFSGRCYEHESVPYKAADGVVDALTHHLGRLDATQRAALLPRDFSALAKLFPVLQPLLEPGSPERDDGGGSKDQRRNGFEALRLVLGTLSRDRPLILYVDDLQWGDDDSSALFLDLLAPPLAPPVLFVGTFRSEDRAVVPLLQALQARESQHLITPEVDEVALPALTAADAETLIRSVHAGQLDPSAIRDLTREAAGSPYLLTELAGIRQESPGLPVEGEGARSRLDTMMRQRLEALPEAARRLAETVALAGRPIPTGVAARAAEMGEETPRALTLLRASRLLRVRDDHGREELVTYHDRIREAANDSLDRERRVLLHTRLAEAYLAHGHMEPEVLYEHWRGAGRPDRALEQAVLAADKARAALAFDRAARFLGIALELAPDAPQSLGWQVALAEAQANSGQGQASAETYLRAVERAPGPYGEELRRRAANEYLRSGLVVEGRELVDQVLGMHGVFIARTPLRAVARLLYRRLRLKLRGTAYRLRSEAEIPADSLQRLDAMLTAAQGLAFSQSVEAAEIQVRCLLEALDAGEPTRLAQSLCAEAGFLSLAGARREAPVKKLMEQVAQLLQQADAGPQARGIALFMGGLTDYHFGRWQGCQDRVVNAFQFFRDQGIGGRWEFSLGDFYLLGSLFFLGELRQIQRLLPSALNAMHEGGDVFGELHLHTRMAPWTWMMADAPHRAREELAGHHGRWTFDRFLLPQLFRLQLEGHLDLYEGRAVNALARFDAARAQIRGSFLMRTETSRVQLNFMLAAASLAVPGADERAQGLIASLLKEEAPWSQALGTFLDGRRSAMHGQLGTALSQLEKAVAGLEAVGMQLHAQAARWQLGKVRGGPRGAGEIQRARQWLQGEGVVNPPRFAAALGVQP